LDRAEVVVEVTIEGVSGLEPANDGLDDEPLDEYADEVADVDREDDDGGPPGC
jgi:hypothetical protein